jgi:hypothetical protein
VARLFIAIILAVLIQSAPNESSAQIRLNEYWLVTGRDDSVSFVDASSIKVIDGAEREFWTVNYNKEEEDGVYHTRYKMRLDCDLETISFLYVANYDKAGSSVYASPMTVKATIVPESTGDYIYQFVCASPSERSKRGFLKVESTEEAALIWFENVR